MTNHEAHDLYIEGLNGMAEQYGSLDVAFIVAIIDTAEHDKVLEIPEIVKAFLQLTHFVIPLPESEHTKSHDMYTEGLRAYMNKYSGNASLAFLEALKDIAQANPRAKHLQETINAYESIVSDSLYGQGLLSLQDEFGSPTSAVAIALQDLLTVKGYEHIDATVQAANRLFGTEWHTPTKKSSVSARKK